MKILLLGEYSNVHWTLAEGLRALGHHVCVVSHGDFWKNYKRDISLVRPTQSKWDGLRYLAKVLATLPRLRGYDVVQLINPCFLELKAERLYAIYNYLRDNQDDSCYAMVGYRLRNTVTENGSVARGVCEVEDGVLTGITERTKIYKRGEDAAYTEDDGATFVDLPGDTIVSMNLWGFSANLLDTLWDRFPAFLDANLESNPKKCEYFLPFVVNDQLADKTASVRVLPCEETWYGVTYREDLESVVSAIADMKKAGIYKEDLWA